MSSILVRQDASLRTVSHRPQLHASGEWKPLEKENPLTPTEKSKKDLLRYFDAIGADIGRIFNVRDIDSQVMMNTFAPEARAGRDYAIAELITEGILRQVTATQYMLTESGAKFVKGFRARKEELAAD
jgi:hypothetical protein